MFLSRAVLQLDYKAMWMEKVVDNDASLAAINARLVRYG